MTYLHYDLSILIYVKLNQYFTACQSFNLEYLDRLSILYINLPL